MSLRGLDSFITGEHGERYWQGYVDEDHDRVCGFCHSGACPMCLGKSCDCSGRYGRKAAEHGPYRGPVKVVRDDTLTLNDNTGVTLDDSKGK